MGLLGGLFKKAKHKGYFEIEISSISRLTKNAVKVSFDIPDKLREKFNELAAASGSKVSLEMGAGTTQEFNAMKCCRVMLTPKPLRTVCL